MIRVLISWLTTSLFLWSCSSMPEQKQMTGIIDSVSQRLFFHPANQYLSSNRVRLLDESILQSPGYGINKLLLQKATALLYAGRSEEAIVIFDSLYRIKKNRHVVDGLEIQEEDLIEKRLALSYLRLGEQQNCIINHTSESCIIPISSKGYHQLKKGSSEAIRLYEEILANNPHDRESQWLLNVAYMTLGKYPHEVPKPYLIPEEAFASEYQLNRFAEIAPSLGLDVDALSGSTIVDDFDNDGYLDVVASSWFLNHSLKFFVNDRRGSFSDKTTQSGLGKIAGGLNMVQADYDNDGFLDIFLLRGAWMDSLGTLPNSLLKNKGDGTFDDVTLSAGLLSFHPTQTASWSDFNNDGWLDLFIGNESSALTNLHPCELYLNNQDGTFREVAAAAGAQLSTAENFYFVKGVVSGDYDNDGWQDLYISAINSDKPNILLKNLGTAENGVPRFENVTERSGLAEPFSSFTCWFWDYNNDGLLDLYVPGYGRNYGTAASISGEVVAEYLQLPHTAVMPRLYRNLGDGKFRNVTEEVKLNRISYAMGANYGDLDNDGFLDIYLGTGEASFASIIPNRMFRNAGGNTFQDVTTAGGFGHLQKGHGVAFADLDNDGDQDIYIVLGGAYEGDNFKNALFLNPGTKNNWLNLKLEGTTANRSAIGSKVWITYKASGQEITVYREVSSGGSFGANPLQLHVGLGDAAMVDKIEIAWAGSHLRQTFQQIAANQFLKVVEGDKQLHKLALENIVFTNSQKHHH